MSAMVPQVTGVSSVCPTVGSSAVKRKHQSSASLAFVRVIHRWPVNSPHNRPVTRKMFPFDDVMNVRIFEEENFKEHTYTIIGSGEATVSTMHFNYEIYPDSRVHGAYLGPTWPRWAPCWPHELCYLGCLLNSKIYASTWNWCCLGCWWGWL